MRDEGPSVNLKWAVAAAAVLLLFSVALILGAAKESPQPGSSYDASGCGLLASYLLLDELGYPVARSRQVRGGDVRWLLFPHGSPRQVRELAAWVRDGGRLVLADAEGVFASDLGLTVVPADPAPERDEEVTGPLSASLRGGETRVEALGPARVWAHVGDRPL